MTNDETERHRLECLAAFATAVLAYRRGDKEACSLYLREIRERCGLETYEISKRELIAYAKSEYGVTADGRGLCKVPEKARF